MVQCHEQSRGVRANRSRRIRRLAGAALLSLVLAACGGGGGDSGTGNANNGYPTLAQDANFQLPAITLPNARPAAAGRLLGQVMLQSESPAGANLSIDLLDASTPATPVVLAHTSTAADGSFDLPDLRPDLPAADRWIRASLADGGVLRAHVAAWTQLTPGSEVAVSEVARLRQAGALAGHTLTSTELQGTQDMLSLVWQSSAGQKTPQEAVSAVRQQILEQSGWNALLERLNGGAEMAGPGDVAATMPSESLEPSWQAQVSASDTGTPVSTTYTTRCFKRLDVEVRDCGITSTDVVDSNENYTVSVAGISRKADLANGDPLSGLLAQIGDLPMLEFPSAPGTRILVDSPRLVLTNMPQYHAAARITRHTYPAASVQAMGGSVMAVKVVHEYQVAILDTQTGQQTDILGREARWFAPQGGRVRFEGLNMIRQGSTTQQSSGTIVATSAATSTFMTAGKLPFAGVADVLSVPLRHRHAVLDAARHLLYVASPDKGGQLLILDSDTLATRGQIALAAVPGRLGLAADGSRLYVGLDGASVIELDTATLSVQRRFNVPADPYGVPYDRIYDLAVDPFNAQRVLVLAGNSQIMGKTGVVLTYVAGALSLRDAPRYSSTDYGWGYYMPASVMWSDQADVFYAVAGTAPTPVYRMQAGANAYAELSQQTPNTADTSFSLTTGGLLGNLGAVLDPSSLQLNGQFSFSPGLLGNCHGLDSTHSMCSVYGSPAYLAVFDNNDRHLTAGYRPNISHVDNGCAEVAITDVQGLDHALYRSMADGRWLVSAVTADASTYCALHIWTPRGLTN